MVFAMDEISRWTTAKGCIYDLPCHYNLMQLEYPQQDKPRNSNVTYLPHGPLGVMQCRFSLQIMICYAKRLGCFAKLAAH